MRKIFPTLIPLTLAACFAANSIIAATKAKEVIAPKDLQKLETVFAEIKKYYVKPVSDHELIDNAISGMLYGLDPHSEYLRKSDLEALETITAGKFSGIGIEVIPDQGLIKIISPLDDTPAAKAGIKPGDTIVQINNKLVKDIQLHDAIALMRGPKDSKVTLTIIRKNSAKPLTFKLKRDTVQVKAVKEKMLGKKFGYLRIAFFQESTGMDVAKALNKLKTDADGMLQGLIIDLRNNPGGLLDTAVQVADHFLEVQKDKGKTNNVIVYTKGNANDASFSAHITAGELIPNVPIVVLINEGSASAAEVLAGALQDYKRALIVGTRSFGKGSVQTLLPAGEDSAVKLTTSLYYTPLGRSIQAKGIEPDITIEELKIPTKGCADNDDNLHIDEASLIDHLQNGNDTEKNKNSVKDREINSENTDSANTKNADNKSSEDKSSEEGEKLKLLHEDYQLHEALNILQGLAITKK